MIRLVVNHAPSETVVRRPLSASPTDPTAGKRRHAAAATFSVAACMACASAGPGSPDIALPEPNVESTTVGATADRTVRDAATALEPADADVLETAHGEATYYADMFEGRRTASGIIFSNAEMFAAHREYPFGTVVRVTELDRGRAVTVRVVDRLPPPRTARARRTIIDLSQRAADELGFIRAGRVLVRLEVLEWGRTHRR